MFSTDLHGSSFNFSAIFVEKVPIPQIDKNRELCFEILVDCILFAKEKGLNAEVKILESVIDGMVFELYFENEVKKAGCEVLKYLTGLTPITDDMTDDQKMKIITKTYNELSDKNHPVRRNLEGMDEIEEIRIIKGLDDQSRFDL